VGVVSQRDRRVAVVGDRERTDQLLTAGQDARRALQESAAGRRKRFAEARLEQELLDATIGAARS